MNMNEVFEGLRKMSAEYCNMAEGYLKKKQDLGKLANDYLSGSAVTSDRIDSLRRSGYGRTLRENRNKLENEYQVSLSAYQKAMREITANLFFSVESSQPGLDVNDQTLQNMLNIASIGKNLPKDTARQILEALRTNRAEFNIVRGSMMKNGLDPETIKDIYPYDGNDMEFTYNSFVHELNDRKGEAVFSTMRKLQKQLISDASAFGVTVDPFVTDELKDRADNYTATRAMGLQSDYDRSVEVLDVL